MATRSPRQKARVSPLVSSLTRGEPFAKRAPKRPKALTALPLCRVRSNSGVTVATLSYNFLVDVIALISTKLRPLRTY